MGGNQLPISKICPPELPSVVPRKHLFDLLEQKKHYTVTWISAMAGSGKTTLVASYLEKYNIPCIWYQLDEGDGDLATFFHYLGIAVRKAFPAEGKSPPTLTPENLPRINIFSRQFFEDLCTRVSSPFYLVFDNYHELGQESRFHEVFRYGLSGISPDIHVIVISRSAPPHVFAGMLANKQMRVIGSKQLFMNIEESGELIRMETGAPLPPDLMNTVYEKTRGWAAGLVLMANSMAKTTHETRNFDELFPDTVLKYFHTEYFNRMDDVSREFMIRTAFLPKMTVDMAKALEGRKDTECTLLFLRDYNLFIHAPPESPRWYVYHPLLREFLKSEAEKRLDKEGLRRLKKRSAMLLLEAGQPEEAIDLLFEADAHRDAVPLVIKHAGDFIKHGKHVKLQRWLRLMPEQLFDSEPWLLFWMGICKLHSAPHDARPFLERALDLFRHRNDTPGTYSSWSAIIESIILEWNDFTELDPWLDWLDREIPKLPQYPSPDIEARVSLSRAAALIIRRPNQPEISKLLEKALLLARNSRDISLYLQVISWAMTYCAWTGDFAKVDVLHGETQKFLKSLVLPPALLIHRKWLDLSTKICSMKGIETAHEETTAALAMVKETGLKMWEHLFLMPGIFISLIFGNLDSAKSLLKRLQSTLDISHYHIFAFYHHLKALYNLHTGDINHAKAHAETALKIAEETGYVFPTLVCRLQLAYIFHEIRKCEKARRELSSILESARGFNSRILEFMCLMLKAKIALDTGNESNGLKTLKQAMALGSKQNFFTMAWWWYSPAISRLCAKALSENIEKDYVQRLVRANRLVPNLTDCLETETWPWPLRIYTLGTFSIEKDGSPLSFSGKTQKIPLNMLKILIAYGGTDVHMDRIIDALWFNADGDLAINAFSTTLNRLRKLVGLKDTILLKGGKLSLNRLYCMIDTWLFDQMLSKAETTLERGLKKEAIAFYKKTINIYRGDFLAIEQEEPWMLPPRERFRDKYLETIRITGKLLEEEDRPEEAINYYERGLRTDNLREAFYQRIMLCYKVMGHRSEAIRTYKRCRSILLSSINTEPSVETTSIYREILEHGQVS